MERQFREVVTAGLYCWAACVQIPTLIVPPDLGQIRLVIFCINEEKNGITLTGS